MKDNQTSSNREPVSELQTYEKVLSQVFPGKPVFLTRNEEDTYVLLDFHEYKEQMLSLISMELTAAITESKKEKRYSFKEVRKELLEDEGINETESLDSDKKH
ncbi:MULTISPECIES: hypothetical protein [Furfurilactobacillus]|uniref:Prevent-host-death family protein n=2 Tax=Furfurilactobacillus rossiae TaxID=231049 RepID=A0A0R1RBW2_9LACO|nr:MULTISPECIES: hypothetical protein [Furfurilactobacillus]KRL53918.1 hypothetical protein FD35_GL000747 [Furfurilactobacillus rossiae DSM 15814]MYV06298.1 prevent-host-death family protein [Furfurilactobacillus milii]QFR66666.1 prevent-host-death family protein [Furfurilactobacillus rossiae]QLE62141.1 hypothetical protein LROSRS0_2096 [Furfurilactobacillus rossiae]